MEYKVYSKDHTEVDNFDLHQYEHIYGKTCDYDIRTIRYIWIRKG